MHPPCRPVLQPLYQPAPRTFSSTTQPLARSSRSALRHAHRDIPTYPHGPSLLYKQSNFGLYGNVRPQFGNMVSERNEIKTRRKWDPNIHDKRLWSVALGKYIQVRVQARVLRTIDKVGGLDEYLLGESPARIKELGMEGWKMRWRLLQDRGVKERLRRRRVELGLPPQGPEMFLSDAELLGEERSMVDPVAKGGEIPNEMMGGGIEDGAEEMTDEEIERMIEEEDEAERQRRPGTLMAKKDHGERTSIHP
ncbi:MAG: hypothetical protein L6R38_008663 [Xanthoria sp. 2 TBL-2021]|nr:MAG: hypothetical protein L6R38_008663 [Xanthoria sp. 2 TBL-2021]